MKENNTENNQKTSEKITPVEIGDEMKKSYLDYSMSVIVGRALPDVRDGLKPVHRRILFAMNDMGMFHNKPFKKSARIVGEVLGKYHPHGDTAVYDSMVRMAQNFSLRYPLIQGQGNFGSIDGDSAAAMRYCITGDSLILTDKGILPIKNISDKKEAIIKMKVLSHNGKNNTASKFFNSGRHKTIRILTKSGYSIEGSYNHPVLTWKLGQNFKPIISWKLLEELNEDDIIIINRNNNLFSKTSLNLKEYCPKEGFRNNVELPKKMNNDLSFLLGALVSEGSYHNKQILFNNQDMEFYNKIRSIILSQFKGIQIYERTIKGNCKELSIYEQKVVLFLKNIGLPLTRSDKKEIPFSVLLSTKENIKHFLTALFEGDGSVSLVTDKRHSGKSIQLNYNSKSEKLISQLKTLLLNFGIISSYPYLDKRYNCLKLIIPSYDNIYKFYKEINFFSKRKKDILRSINNINSSRLSKTDFIPFLNDYLRNKYSSNILKHYNFDRYNSIKKNHTKLQKIIDKEDKIFLDWILKNNFYFDQLIRIERSKNTKEVFSVKVNSNCHSFIANGFINHNTEARLNRLSEEILQDIEKNTVRFTPNFDESLKEPTVLPSKVPNLLINGSSGIAVGMATNIPPHNLKEISNTIIKTIDNPEITTNELIENVKGPDFPTGGIIQGRQGILHAYSTGRGRIRVRAKTKIEKNKDKKALIIKETPYQVNKASLVQEIAGLVKNKTVTGISDIRDESDREGMRVVIELKKDTNPDILLNQLFAHSRMQITFGIIMLVLVDNKPEIVTLKRSIQLFIKHRQDIVRKRTEFDLKKAEERAHILKGLVIALNNIDQAIKLIKQSKSAEIAKNELIKHLSIDTIQAQAILDMKLQRLTSLEQEKIRKELEELKILIQKLKDILADEKKILKIIKDELEELNQKYGDERKTEILDIQEEDIEIEDLIEPEDTIITITHSGYIKRVAMDTYRQQKRGGRGIVATGTREDDFVEDIFIANTHDYIMFFTDKGQVYWLKVFKIPEASRQARGSAIINLINSKKDEKITAFIPIKIFDKDHYLLLATKKGIVKKTNLMAYSKPRQGGIKSIILEPEDELINAKLTDGNQNIILATENGLAIKFNEKDARSIGRTSKGVKGITLKKDDKVIGIVIAKDEKTLLTVTRNGYGKRTRISEYRNINRGGVGVINIQCSERNGKVTAVKSVTDEDDIMLISKKGILIRTSAKNISTIGRNTQGVRVMKLEQEDELISAAKIAVNGKKEPEKEEGSTIIDLTKTG